MCNPPPKKKKTRFFAGEPTDLILVVPPPPQKKTKARSGSLRKILPDFPRKRILVELLKKKHLKRVYSPAKFQPQDWKMSFPDSKIWVPCLGGPTSRPGIGVESSSHPPILPSHGSHCWPQVSPWAFRGPSIWRKSETFFGWGSGIFRVNPKKNNEKTGGYPPRTGQATGLPVEFLESCWKVPRFQRIPSLKLTLTSSLKIGLNVPKKEMNHLPVAWNFQGREMFSLRETNSCLTGNSCVKRIVCSW